MDFMLTLSISDCFDLEGGTGDTHQEFNMQI